MSELREQMAAASQAHKDALDETEAQVADANRLASLYEHQIADLSAQLQGMQQVGVDAAGMPATPAGVHSGARRAPSRAHDEGLIAAAAELLSQSPGAAAAGLQAQGRSFADIVAMYADMVGAIDCSMSSAGFGRLLLTYVL